MRLPCYSPARLEYENSKLPFTKQSNCKPTGKLLFTRVRNSKSSLHFQGMIKITNWCSGNPSRSLHRWNVVADGKYSLIWCFVEPQTKIFSQESKEDKCPLYHRLMWKSGPGTVMRSTFDNMMFCWTSSNEDLQPREQRRCVFIVSQIDVKKWTRNSYASQLAGISESVCKWLKVKWALASKRESSPNRDLSLCAISSLDSEFSVTRSVKQRNKELVNRTQQIAKDKVIAGV